LFLRGDVAERLCKNLIGSTVEPWKVWECIVALPGEAKLGPAAMRIVKVLKSATGPTYLDNPRSFPDNYELPLRIGMGYIRAFLAECGQWRLHE
jgi:hypothetical protein